MDKETLLSAAYCPVEDLWEKSPLAEGITEVANGSFKDREPPEIEGSGYVVKSMEALWAFYRSRGFCEGAFMAANLGNDADATAAIYRQIASAPQLTPAIPAELRDRMSMTTETTSMADSLYDHSRHV